MTAEDCKRSCLVLAGPDNHSEDDIRKKDEAERNENGGKNSNDVFAEIEVERITYLKIEEVL